MPAKLAVKQPQRHLTDRGAPRPGTQLRSLVANSGVQRALQRPGVSAAPQAPTPTTPTQPLESRHCPPAHNRLRLWPLTCNPACRITGAFARGLLVLLCLQNLYLPSLSIIRTFRRVLVAMSFKGFQKSIIRVNISSGFPPCPSPHAATAEIRPSEAGRSLKKKKEERGGRSLRGRCGCDAM